MDYIEVDGVYFSGVGKAIIVLNYNGGEQNMFFVVSILLFESLEQTTHSLLLRRFVFLIVEASAKRE